MYVTDWGVMSVWFLGTDLGSTTPDGTLYHAVITRRRGTCALTVQ